LPNDLTYRLQKVSRPVLKSKPQRDNKISVPPRIANADHEQVKLRKAWCTSTEVVLGRRTSLCVVTSLDSGWLLSLCGTDHVYPRYPRVTFGALPDDVLLEIFNFYLAIMVFEPSWFRPFPEDAWHMLVHVCKRWRSIVFASPHRLKLQLLCTNKRPVQHMPDIWPELPIVISGSRGMSERQDTNNIIAALTQHDLVAKIDMSRYQIHF
jgi:hypothetical protein